MMKPEFFENAHNLEALFKQLDPADQKTVWDFATYLLRRESLTDGSRIALSGPPPGNQPPVRGFSQLESAGDYVPLEELKRGLGL